MNTSVLLFKRSDGKTGWAWRWDDDEKSVLRGRRGIKLLNIHDYSTLPYPTKRGAQIAAGRAMKVRGEGP